MCPVSAFSFCLPLASASWLGFAIIGFAMLDTTNTNINANAGKITVASLFYGHWTGKRTIFCFDDEKQGHYCLSPSHNSNLVTTIHRHIYPSPRPNRLSLIYCWQTIYIWLNILATTTHHHNSTHDINKGSRTIPMSSKRLIFFQSTLNRLGWKLKHMPSKWPAGIKDQFILNVECLWNSYK